jgi:cytochrome c oxidase subunit 4
MASKNVSRTKTAQVKKPRSAYVTGAIVAIVLAVLTIVEYYIGLHFPSPTLLLLISVLKAALVVYFFMHVYRLWRADEGGH